MENTTNLKLPLLIPNQSGKEITHNEALVVIDNILQNGVIDKDLATPPENPNSNDIYIVGKNAIGDWADKDKQIAFYDNGWRFVKPREGFIFWVNDEDKLYTYNGSKWIEAVASSSSGNTGGTSDAQELNDLSDVEITSAGKYDILQHDGTDFVNTKSLQQLTMLGINATADSDNKLSVKSDYVLFDKSTDNSRVKVNKAASTDTASHLFQTNYGGRAEFGLIGNDDFTLKVSNDGETWNNAFVVDGTTGNIDFKGEITKNGESIGGGSSGGINSSTTIIANNDTMVEFTNLDTTKIHKFFIQLKPNENTSLEFQLSNDNGANYANTSYYGSHTGRTWTTGDLISENENNSPSFRCGIFVINNAIYQLSNTDYSYIEITLQQKNSNFITIKTMAKLTNYHATSFGGGTQGALGNSINAIKFYLSSGTFNSGSIVHYVI